MQILLHIFTKAIMTTPDCQCVFVDGTDLMEMAIRYFAVMLATLGFVEYA